MQNPSVDLLVFEQDAQSTSTKAFYWQLHLLLALEMKLLKCTLSYCISEDEDPVMSHLHKQAMR